MLKKSNKDDVEIRMARMARRIIYAFLRVKVKTNKIHNPLINNDCKFTLVVSNGLYEKLLSTSSLVIDCM